MIDKAPNLSTEIRGELRRLDCERKLKERYGKDWNKTTIEPMSDRIIQNA